MDVLDPCAFPGQAGGVENNYEEDLLRFLGELSLNDMDQMRTYSMHRMRAGDPLSDADVAMIDLLQQALALASLNQDRALAQQIAAGEDVGDQHWPVERPDVVPLWG